MAKKIFYLVMFLFLSLFMIQGFRTTFIETLFYPTIYSRAEQSTNAKLYLCAAKIKFASGKYEETRTILSKILKIRDIDKNKSVYEDSLMLLGHSYYEQYDFTNALKAYYLALKTNPANKDALRKSVRIFMAYEKAEDALPLVNRYLSEKKEDAFALTERCAIYNRIGKTYDAARDCELAIKKRKGYARAYYDYGVAMEKLQFDDKAQDYFKQAKLRDKNIKSREEIEQVLLNAAKVNK